MTEKLSPIKSRTLNQEQEKEEEKTASNKLVTFEFCLSIMTVISALSNDNRTNFYNDLCNVIKLTIQINER